MDSPGHGKTPLPAASQGRTDDVAVVVGAANSWCEKIVARRNGRPCTEMPRVVLVGRSYGGGIVLDAGTPLSEQHLNWFDNV